MAYACTQSDEVSGRKRVTKVKTHEDDFESGSTTAEDIAESKVTMEFFKTLRCATHYGLFVLLKDIQCWCGLAMGWMGEVAAENFNLIVFDMSDVFTKAIQMKKDLADLYDQTILFERELPTEYSNLFSKLYDVKLPIKLSDNSGALVRDFNIAVAGETESLVRSFINVLVGSEVIPYFLVTEPSIVCTVHAIPYGEEQYIELQMAENEEHTIHCNSRSLKKTWKKLQTTLKGKTCHRVDFYWHLPYFKNTTNVTIISNPTNEDSEKMASFVSDASILIYVLRTTTTDCANEDKLMQLCKHIHGNKKQFSFNSFDPRHMMFVCMDGSKDAEQEQSETLSWHELVANVQKFFPRLSEDGHILNLDGCAWLKMGGFLLSSNCQKDKLERFLYALKRMVDAQQIGTIQKHYSWLDSFTQQVLKYASDRISFARNAKVTKGSIREKFECVNRFYKETEKMKTELEQLANSQCMEMTELLKKHFKQTSVKSDIKSRFYANKDLDIPTDTDILGVQELVRTHILKMILLEIDAWEQSSKHYQRTVEMVKGAFENKCQVLREAYLEVEHFIEGVSESQSRLQVYEGNIVLDALWDIGGFVKDFLTDTPILNIATYISIGVVGLLALPVVFGVVAKLQKDLDKFHEDSSPFLDKWLKGALKDFLKKKYINKLVRKHYLSRLEGTIDMMCEHIVPFSMKANKVLLDDLLKNTRNSKTIVAEFSPVRSSVQDHITNLRLYHLKFLAHDTFNPMKVKTLVKITSGHCSDVYTAEYLEADVTIKVVNGRSCDLFSHMGHLEMLRRFQHEYSVRFIGVCYTDMLPALVGTRDAEPSSSRLMFMFERCDKTLQDYIFSTPKLQCGNIESVLRKEALQFYNRTAQCICTALIYLHGKGQHHGQLSLANTLWTHGAVKILEPSVPNHAIRIDCTRLIAPEVMSGGMVGKETDIFNLGTLLWELWYGRLAGTDSQVVKTSLKSLPRPSCTAKQPMPEGLARCVERCWDSCPDNRPNASTVLQEIITLV